MSIFRKEYRPLTDAEKQLVSNIKDTADALAALYKTPGYAGREQALALTNLEQSVMWAVKGVTG